MTKFDDGFWRIEGQAEDVYYGSEATATKIAANLDKQDAEKAAAKKTAPAPAPAATKK
ncbi:MAG TPA: hypothetical protein VNH17_09705 [Streptosporangiaceae bacterium]|nr:hypothetical protein [Streptosporangiaceae bacterium]